MMMNSMKRLIHPIVGRGKNPRHQCVARGRLVPTVWIENHKLGLGFSKGLVF